MPVTAKLLRKFYEAFGQELTGELVDWANELDTSHRTELRDLADQYYARFDAKLEQRLAETKVDFHQAMADIEAGLKQDIADVRVALAATESRLVRWIFLFWLGTIGISMLQK